MISLLFDSSFLFIVLALGAIMYIIAKQGKPEQSRYLEFLLLTIVTTCVFLFDNPLRSNPYAGLLFYVFDFYIFTSASLAFSFTAIYKSTKHLKYYPSSYSKFLRINAWFLAIIYVTAPRTRTITRKGVSNKILIMIHTSFREPRSLRKKI